MAVTILQLRMKIAPEFVLRMEETSDWLIVMSSQRFAADFSI